ncbi:MAG: hypothetical protein IJ773_12370 [Lachnospiraceae bacterium]|nr:hypothetical protein [Lachnospiraceae bacterium]
MSSRKWKPWKRMYLCVLAVLMVMMTFSPRVMAEDIIEQPPAQYTRTAILSTATKTEMARGFAPTGWKVNGTIHSFGMGIATPVQVDISAASPDNKAMFQYYSRRSFADHLSTYNDQVFKANEGDYDSDYMALCYNYRTASDYCDMLVNEFLQEGIATKLFLEIGPTEEQQKFLKEREKQLKDEFREVGKLTGRDMKLDAAECTYATKFYSLTLKDAFTKAGTKKADQVEYVLVASTMVEGTKWSTEYVYGGGGRKVTGPFGIEMVDGFRTTTVNIDWYPMASYLALIPRERFEELYPMFEEFVNNTRVSDEFFLMRSEMSSQIQNTVQLIRSGINVELDFEKFYKDACKKYLNHALYVTESEMLYPFFADYSYFLTTTDEVFRVYDGYGNAFEDGKGNLLFTREAQSPAGMTACRKLTSPSQETPTGPSSGNTLPSAEAETTAAGVEVTPAETEEETKATGWNFKFPFK